MKPRTIILALSFAALVAFGGNLLMRLANRQTPQQMAEVFVLSEGVPRGTHVTPDMIQTKIVPASVIPVGSVMKREDIIGRTTSVSVNPGIVLEAHLAPKGTEAGLRGLIPKGRRAFTIHTPSDSSGVAGLIRPEDRVDVMLTIDDRTAVSGSTVTLLQNLEILAVDQQIDRNVAAKKSDKPDRNRRGVQSVTLLTTPLEARKLVLGQNHGKLSLALRNPHSDEAESEDGLEITWNEMLGRELADQLVAAGGDFAAAPKTDAPTPAPQPTVTQPTIMEAKTEDTPRTPQPMLPPIVTLRGGVKGYVPLRRVESTPNSAGFNQHVASMPISVQLTTQHRGN
ncbi:MAG: Flp pilus assembly protein CpaB [Planctomycetota bacterium]|nr:Flp pilus assembly protein CpaB [Planctomycetota bacterium]